MTKKKEKLVAPTPAAPVEETEPDAPARAQKSFAHDVTASAESDPTKKGRSQKTTKVKALKTFTYRYGRYRYAFTKGGLYPIREEMADHLRASGRVI